VLKAFEPQVSQAVHEFPGGARRARQAVGDGPIGVVGASIGALPAHLVMADGSAPVKAAALVSPVIQLAEVVAANKRRFRVSCPWSDVSRAVAARVDLVARAADTVGRKPAACALDGHRR
jgi:alpha-beta hydrolase superfamily lysophospholipase